MGLSHPAATALACLMVMVATWNGAGAGGHGGEDFAHMDRSHASDDIGIWWHNRTATLEVHYSLTRPHLPFDPGYPPEWKDGVVVIRLYEDKAPVTTANFIGLAESGFYDGTIFHRIIDDFVCQGGDPDANDPFNDGTGDPIPLECHPDLTHIDGAVGMARDVDPDSAESQFYICDGPQHQLDDAERRNRTPPESGYAVFGVVIEGLDIVREMATVWTDTDANNTEPLPIDATGAHDRPIYDVTLERVTISEKVERDDGDDGKDDDTTLPGVDDGPLLVAALAVPALLIFYFVMRKGLLRRMG